MLENKGISQVVVLFLTFRVELHLVGLVLSRPLEWLQVLVLMASSQIFLCGLVDRVFFHGSCLMICVRNLVSLE